MPSPLGERLRRAFLKPAPPSSAPTAGSAGWPRALAEVEAEVRYANDKERLIGLLSAPLAAAIGLLVIGNLQSLPAKNNSHISSTLFGELLLVLLALSIVMLASAWFRKRAYLGMAMGLYGITIFNLHYWGFGVPFAMVAAWLLVRTFRLQRELKAAGGGPSRANTGPGRNNGSSARARAKASKRYTPPR